MIAVPSPTQIIVHVYGDGNGNLLLTAREPMREHFHSGVMVGLEVALLLDEITGQQSLNLSLIPPVGYKWTVPLKSAHPCAASVTI